MWGTLCVKILKICIYLLQYFAMCDIIILSVYGSKGNELVIAEIYAKE